MFQSKNKIARAKCVVVPSWGLVMMSLMFDTQSEVHRLGLAQCQWALYERSRRLHPVPAPIAFPAAWGEDRPSTWGVGREEDSR